MVTHMLTMDQSKKFIKKLLDHKSRLSLGKGRSDSFCIKGIDFEGICDLEIYIYYSYMEVVVSSEYGILESYHVIDSKIFAEEDYEFKMLYLSLRIALKEIEKYSKTCLEEANRKFDKLMGYFDHF